MKPVYAVVITENNGKETSHEGWLNSSVIADNAGRMTSFDFTLQPSTVYDPEAFHIHIDPETVRNIYPGTPTALLEATTIETTGYIDVDKEAYQFSMQRVRELENYNFSQQLKVEELTKTIESQQYEINQLREMLAGRDNEVRALEEKLSVPIVPHLPEYDSGAFPEGNIEGVTAE